MSISGVPDEFEELMPCPACPDGYVWNGNGPTRKPCPVCKGLAAVGYRAAQEEQSAATPSSAGSRADHHGAAQAVTDGPAADPDASVITYARIGLRYMHDPRVRATYSDLIDLSERMARERDDARAERDALREVVRELVACDDESNNLAAARLYGKPHMPEYKARELDYRQRKIEAWRAARAKVKP